MRLAYFAAICVICCAMAMPCRGTTEENGVPSVTPSTTVVPLPEAKEQYNSPTPVDAIVVDKDGNMSERKYTYDPNQGGVVINNYYQVAGPDCSIYFPLFGMGFLWWGGYWVDHRGYYWNGTRYAYVHHSHWHDHWNHYWHHDWENKRQHFNNHHRSHDGHGHGDHGEHFDHHGGGQHRPSHSHGHQGGDRGRGHGGGGHGGGHGGGKR